MQKITPCLWFDDQAEQAAKFYVSLFKKSKNSKITGISYYGEAGPGKAGTVLVVTFRLAGQDFMAVNGGPQFPFTEAVSLVVNCKTQQELNDFWRKLSQGGKPQQCGWIKDKYGLPWQIVPTILDILLQDKNAKKANRVMKAMLKMVKLDIKKLQQAYDRG